MFALDEKNYHVWSYRQWLVRRFDLWAPADAPAAALANPELRFVERLLAADVRNNSAWNHRWFVVFGRPTTTTTSSALDTPAIVLREASFAKAAIRTAPQNESPWSYLRGLAARSPAILPLASLTAFALEFAPVPALLSAAPPSPDAPVDAAATAGPAAGAGAAPGTKVTSSHALDVLAEIYAAEPEGADLACVALDLLARGYDPVRAKYWRYRKGLIGGGGAAAAAAAAAAKEGVVA
jgi:protein farnesyltransferase/geranylgeranyltransferase type-1 subunit alpha